MLGGKPDFRSNIGIYTPGEYVIKSPGGGVSYINMLIKVDIANQAHTHTHTHTQGKPDPYCVMYLTDHTQSKVGKGRDS